MPDTQIIALVAAVAAAVQGLAVLASLVVLRLSLAVTRRLLDQLRHDATLGGVQQPTGAEPLYPMLAWNEM